MSLLICFVLMGTTVKCYSGEAGIWFPEASAKKLYIDKKYCEETLKYCTEKSDILEETVKLQEEKYNKSEIVNTQEVESIKKKVIYGSIIGLVVGLTIGLLVK